MKAKKPSVRKPVLDGDLALSFAEGAGQRARRRSAKSEPQKTGSRSGYVPEGDVRLTVNVREDLHLRLKVEAAHRRTTIGEIIEELIDAHVGENSLGKRKHT